MLIRETHGVMWEKEAGRVDLESKGDGICGRQCRAAGQTV